MKVLLTGGSGFIGRHIAEELQDAGHRLVIISRANGIDVNDLLTPTDWRPYLHDVDAVINCIGIIAETGTQRFTTLHYQAPAALFRACVDEKVPRVIQISALGADGHAFTSYQLSKKAADDVLRGLPLDWFILRPSLVFGLGGKSTTLFQRLANLPVIPLVGRGEQRIQPVHIDDLVATVVACLTATPAQRTLDVVGPADMTFAEWLQRLRRHNGKARAMTISIPIWLMLAIAQLAKSLVPLLHPDNLRMLQQDNTADVQPLVAFLGRDVCDLP